MKINALPFAAYQMIYNEYYRDQNQIADINFYLDNGDNSGANHGTLTALRTRAWEHDYFTSALPWAQRGNQVSIPLGTFLDVPVNVEHGSGAPFDITATPNHVTAGSEPSNNPAITAESLYAQTSSLTDQAANINDLRRAFKLKSSWNATRELARAMQRLYFLTLASSRKTPGYNDPNISQVSKPR